MTESRKRSSAIAKDACECDQRHERYVMKLREAEIEAIRHPETVSQKQLDERMNTLFAKWSVS